MRAVKGADAEMHAADAGRGALVGGPPYLWIEQSEQARVQPLIHHGDAGRSGVALQVVCALDQLVGEFHGYVGRVVFPKLMLGNQFGKKSAVDAPRYVVPRRYRQEGARIVVESDRVVETGGLSDLAPQAPHAFGAVVKPPCRSELEGRIVAGERGQPR